MDEIHKLKILMPVLHYYPVIGGLENWTQNIAERLSEQNDIYIITGRVKAQPVREKKNGVYVFRTSLFALKNLSYSSLFYILSALPFIFFKSLLLARKEKIDIIHCQGFLSSCIGFLLSKIFNISYIITVQRMEKKSFFRKLVYENARLCIGASFAIKMYFEQIGIKNSIVIPNGVDLQKFQNLRQNQIRAKLGLKDEFIITTVARLEKIKGVEYLIKALSNYRLRIINYKLLIIGEGSRRQALEELSKKLGLSENIKFLGQIQNKEIPKYLAISDCFILPSLQEGFGIAVLEAQASKVPVIASNVGGISDIIEDGKTGVLIEPKDSEQIAQAVIKMFSDQNFGKVLTKNAFQKLEKYDWQNIANKVFSVYQSI